MATMSSATSMRRPGPSQTPGMNQSQAQHSAAVLEYRCMFSHDVHKKAKKWHDGSLRFHTFNKRVMVYDESKNLVGDLHYRQPEEFGEGLEFKLDRPVLVQVEEPMGQTTTDLNQVLAPNRTRQPQEGPSQPVSQITRANVPRINAASSQGRAKSIKELLGAPQGRLGRARLPTQSPFEQRTALTEVQNSVEPPAKRQRLMQQSERQKVPSLPVPRVVRPERASPQRPPIVPAQHAPTNTIDLSSDEAVEQPVEEVPAPRPLIHKPPPQAKACTVPRPQSTKTTAAARPDPTIGEKPAPTAARTITDSRRQRSQLSSRMIQSQNRKLPGPKSALSLSAAQPRRSKLLCLSIPPSTAEKADTSSRAAAHRSAQRKARAERNRLLYDSDDDIGNPVVSPARSLREGAHKPLDVRPVMRTSSPQVVRTPSPPIATAYAQMSDDVAFDSAEMVPDSPLFFPQSQASALAEFSDFEESQQLPPAISPPRVTPGRSVSAARDSSPTSTISSPGFFDLTSLRNPVRARPRATIIEEDEDDTDNADSYMLKTNKRQSDNDFEDGSATHHAEEDRDTFALPHFESDVQMRPPSPTISDWDVPSPQLFLARSETVTTYKSPERIIHDREDILKRPIFKRPDPPVMAPPVIRRKQASPFRPPMAGAIPPSTFGDFPDEDMTELLEAAERGILSSDTQVRANQPVEAVNAPRPTAKELGLPELVEHGPWSTLEAYMLFDQWPKCKTKPDFGKPVEIAPMKPGQRAMGKKYGMFKSARFVSQR